MKQCMIICVLAILAASCNKKSTDVDENGFLNAELLTSTEGGVNFTPMKHEDSAYAVNFKPTIYTYNNAPYTGKINAFNGDKLMMEGSLKDGIYSGAWKFYYPSGVVQIEGNYTNGLETGFWKSYYRKDFYSIVKYYDNNGFMLMRKEYFDNGKIKNYQNIKCPEFGNVERRIQFKYSGEIDYLDAERGIGKLNPADVNKMLQEDGLMVK